jgi:hypothetical protein
MAKEYPTATSGGGRSSTLSGGVPSNDKAAIIKDPTAAINSGKMKLVKQEIPLGGPGKAVANFAERTGARIIADRKGAQIVAEKAAAENKVSKVAARRVAEEAAGPKARSVTGNPNRATSTGAIRATAPKPGVKVTTITSRGTKVTGGIKRTTNTQGSAIKITSKPPMSAKEIEQNQITKNAAAKTARSIEGGVGKRPTPPGGPKMDEATKIKNKGLAVVSKGKSMTKSPSLKDYEYEPGKPRENSRPTIESRSSQNPASRGTNIEKAAKPFDEQEAEANRRVSAGLKNQAGDEIAGKKPDMPNSKAVGERARQRPGLAKRKEATVIEARARANAAMNKRGLNPAQKKTLIMKSRAKAIKIARGTK